MQASSDDDDGSDVLFDDGYSIPSDSDFTTAESDENSQIEIATATPSVSGEETEWTPDASPDWPDRDEWPNCEEAQVPPSLPPKLPVVDEDRLQHVWPLGAESFSTFTCPITHSVMTDPVVAADGYSYERDAIAKWFQTSNISPVTGENLHSRTALVPNQAVRTLIKTMIDMTEVKPVVTDVEQNSSSTTASDKTVEATRKESSRISSRHDAVAVPHQSGSAASTPRSSQLPSSRQPPSSRQVPPWQQHHLERAPLRIIRPRSGASDDPRWNGRTDFWSTGPRGVTMTRRPGVMTFPIDLSTSERGAGPSTTLPPLRPSFAETLSSPACGRRGSAS